MNDQELLTYAAKAAGYIETASVQNGFGFIALVVMDQDGDWTGKDWNPLENDADAFQLMVKLLLAVEVGHIDTEVFYRDDRKYKKTSCANPSEKGNATRRAIVMAAAEIGKAMK